MNVTVLHGQAHLELASLADCSIDAVVCDPPYGLSDDPDIAEVLTHWLAGDDYAHTGAGFAGKTWDSFVPGPVVWREVLRALKPGGHLLAFAGSRTVDLMGVAIRLGGFQIRDQMQWLYSSGMPKSLNVAKAMAKAGVDGEQWDGWGTNLKPAHEPIVVARKPLVGSVVANVSAWGVGAMNVDACRVTPSETVTIKTHDNGARPFGGSVGEPYTARTSTGRWPANVLVGHHDDCVLVGKVADTFGGGSKMSRTGGAVVDFGGGYAGGDGFVGQTVDTDVYECVPVCPASTIDAQAAAAAAAAAERGNRSGTATGASRFFYSPKASRAERLDGLDEKNPHTTVKPVALMRYLVRLVTPPGGVVLDPFCGSGTTLVAAVHEGFDAVGIDRDDDGIYLPVARARVAHAGGHIADLAAA